ncbi:MAG: T9SS type A sorting domain-containing protein [Elusimicrobia bacterium]|nr:T9SS type A sorting domain-containing protein [Elusimicrobiota bacterium]
MIKQIRVIQSIWLFLAVGYYPLVAADDPEWDVRLFKRNEKIMEIVRESYYESLNSSSTANSSPSRLSTQNLLIQGADPTFKLGEIYCYPNPAKRQNPTFHIEVGVADKVDLRLYDISGDLIHEISLSGDPQIIDNGQGLQYAYEYPWDASNIGSGVYVFVVQSFKANKETLKKIGKCVIVK